MKALEWRQFGKRSFSANLPLPIFGVVSMSFAGEHCTIGVQIGTGFNRLVFARKMIVKGGVSEMKHRAIVAAEWLMQAWFVLEKGTNNVRSESAVEVDGV